jgi:hypothetical protein
MGYRLAKVGLCVSMLLVVQGCGKEAPPPIVPAQGVVLLRGKPLPKAQIRFIPDIDYGAAYIATAVTDDSGRFTLECNGQPGACVGENTVTVGEADIPKELQSENAQRQLYAYTQSLKNRPIPKKYASPVSTPLKATVAEGQTEYKLELSQ